jgi:hypothetical protein
MVYYFIGLLLPFGLSLLLEQNKLELTQHLTLFEFENHNCVIKSLTESVLHLDDLNVSVYVHLLEPLEHIKNLLLVYHDPSSQQVIESE